MMMMMMMKAGSFICLHLRNYSTVKLHEKIKLQLIAGRYLPVFSVDLITRRRSYSFAEYWKHFVARLNGVHAFGYNSAGSEPIWMKFGAL